MSGQKFISEAPGSRGERALLQEAAGTLGARQAQRNGGRDAVWFGDGALETMRWSLGTLFEKGWSLLTGCRMEM